MDLSIVVQEMLVEQRRKNERGDSAGSVPAEKLEDQVMDETTLASSMKRKKKRALSSLPQPNAAINSGAIQQEELEDENSGYEEDYEEDEEYEEVVEQRDFSSKERDKAANSGHAMPDGSYPINSVSDLKNAIAAHGRAKNKAAAKAHIKKRAKAMGQSDMLPDSWSQEDDSVTQSGSGFLNWLKDLFYIEQGTVEQDLGIPGPTISPIQPEVGVSNPQQVNRRKKKRKPLMKQIGEEDPEDLKEAKAHNKVRVTQEAPIIQMDVMKRIVTGVVQTPDIDVRPASMPNTILVYPKATVQQMAYDFMKSYHNGQIGIRHTEVQQGQIMSLKGEHATVVESYIAPIDMSFPDGRTVVQGSWVMSVQIADEQAWQDVLSGDLKAFSLSSTDVDFTTLGD